MSVIKAKRKSSPFEVMHNAYKIRTVVTDLALRKFGLKEYEPRPKPADYDKWEENQKAGYDKSVQSRISRYEAFVEWFIPDEQKAIVSLVRNLIHEIFLANEIHPRCICECDERRIHQDLALGHCENILQELQYVISTLNVDLEKYENITEMINYEQALIKGWRKSDNQTRAKIYKEELSANRDSVLYSIKLLVRLFKSELENFSE